MQTVVIQLNHQKALSLLQELEAMHIIKIVKEAIIPAKQQLSDKFAGKLNPDVADKLQKHVTNTREKWNSNS